jgi:hypothetical protein
MFSSPLKLDGIGPFKLDGIPDDWYLLSDLNLPSSSQAEMAWWGVPSFWDEMFNSPIKLDVISPFKLDGIPDDWNLPSSSQGRDGFMSGSFFLGWNVQ